MNVTKQLKAARLIVGADDKDFNELRIIPRVPPSWKGYEASDWVILTKYGIARVDFVYSKEGKKINFKINIKENQKIRRIAVRLPYKGGWKWFYKKNTSTFEISVEE